MASGIARDTCAAAKTVPMRCASDVYKGSAFVLAQSVFGDLDNVDFDPIVQAFCKAFQFVERRKRLRIDLVNFTCDRKFIRACIAQHRIFPVEHAIGGGGGGPADENGMCEKVVVLVPALERSVDKYAVHAFNNPTILRGQV